MDCAWRKLGHDPVNPFIHGCAVSMMILWLGWRIFLLRNLLLDRGNFSFEFSKCSIQLIHAFDLNQSAAIAQSSHQLNQRTAAA